MKPAMLSKRGMSMKIIITTWEVLMVRLMLELIKKGLIRLSVLLYQAGISIPSVPGKKDHPIR
jgi:hypothetical protein